MVQIITMPRTRTVSQAIGEGIGEGFSKGVEAALQDISYEKRLSIQGRQQLMLEEQREARQDQKIWKAANIVSAAKGYPDSAYAIFSMEKASPGFLSKVNEDWAPEDWQNLDSHIKQYSNDQINNSQNIQPPPAAQTAGAQVNGAQGTGSAIQSTNINPRDTASIQQGIMQPMANMRPPSPFPDVNKARATQAIAPVSPVTQQAAPQEAGQQQRAPIAPIGPAIQPQPEAQSQPEAKEMTYAEKVAYNNQHYPRKKALEMNKQALAEESLRESKRRGDLKEKIYEESKNEPFRKQINELREKVLKEETSLDLAESSINSGDTSSLGSKGVNQFIEKRMLSMFPVVGQSDEANLSLVEALRFQVALDKKKVELYDKYEDLYKNNPLKIEKEVFKDLNAYVEKEKSNLAYKLSEIRDNFASRSELASTKKAIPGSYITQKRADILKEMAHGDGRKAQEAAKKMGYKFPGEQ